MRVAIDLPDSFLSPLFDAAVARAIAPVEDAMGELPPEEAALVARAVESRRREFSTGRRLARRLIADRGIGPGPILRDDDRVPIWPAGIAGSISHSRAFAVVAVCDAASCFGVGIDVEPDEPVKDGIERHVCTPAEREWLDGIDADEAGRGRRVKLVFSAKEAVYKAFYPRVRVFWGFHDVMLELDEEGGRFRASLPASAGRRHVEGRFVRGHGTIVSGVLAP
ncbi:MAG: 4'-phosphopantetheinyl transferase superfamily protein [Myxococcota bacterium]